MTIYGNTSRVSVETTGGGIAAVSGGGADKLVIFARGDVDSGTASANDPTSVNGPGSLDETFGADTRIVELFRQASGNGHSYNLIWGVMPEELTTQAEDITGGGSAADHTGGSKIANAPLVEDTSLITVTDTADGSEVDVEFRYETNTDATKNDFTGLTPPENTMFINRANGEWVADVAGNYEIDYPHLDWQSAFEAATGVVEEQEMGTWWVESESTSVFNDAISTATPLRENQWKMVKLGAPAEPNETSESNTAHLNTGDYDDSIDANASFLFGPTRLGNSAGTVGGAIAGIMASNAMGNPIIAESLSGVGNLDQTLDVPEQETIEGKGVIPLSNQGAPTIESNVSTSTETDWLRTFFSRRLSDRLLLSARALARASRGRLNNDNTESIVGEQLTDEIVDLIGQDILRPNTEDEQRWFVDVNQNPSNPRKLDVSFGFTPTGVVDVVDVTQTINY